MSYFQFIRDGVELAINEVLSPCTATHTAAASERADLLIIGR
jgi:hypothetical protein